MAQDLGALFGTQSSEPVNHTHDHDHDDHDHEENHHDHDHHDHNTSEAPTVKTTSKSNINTKEIIGKENKNKERKIEVTKKSVDWSQYFGLDRRRKKAIYVGKPDSQDQDNEYLLQKYYEV